MSADLASMLDTQATPTLGRATGARWNVPWKWVYAVLLLVLAGWLWWPGSFPVRQVRIVGDLRYLSQQQVRQVVLAQPIRGFFDADLDRIRSDLQREPWIEAASVRRVWPDQLMVSVREQFPLVRWGNQGFLNRAGHLVLLEGGLKDGSLSLLHGPAGSHQEMLKLLFSLYPPLAEQDLRVRELHLNERRSWSMKLSNGWEVMLGRVELNQRVDRFTRIAVPVLNAQSGQVETVDMRYSNGYAVRWQSDPDVVQLELKE